MWTLPSPLHVHHYWNATQKWVSGYQRANINRSPCNIVETEPRVNFCGLAVISVEQSQYSSSVSKVANRISFACQETRTCWKDWRWWWKRRTATSMLTWRQWTQRQTPIRYRKCRDKNRLYFTRKKENPLSANPQHQINSPQLLKGNIVVLLFSCWCGQILHCLYRQLNVHRRLSSSL